MGKKKKKQVFNFPLLDEKDISNTNDVKCASYRGKIIHYMVELESLLDWALMRYYIRNDEVKIYDFTHSILGEENLMLHSKFLAISYILHNRFPSFIPTHSYFLTTFDELITLRNKVAHLKMTAVFQHGNKIKYSLADVKTSGHKPKGNIIYISKDELRVFYGKYNQLRKDLAEIIDLIENGNKKEA